MQRAALFATRLRVEALEIVAEHFLDLTAEQRDELELLRAHFSLTVHALGTSIGSADGVDERYLERIARLVELARPRWSSDHLAFTRIGGVQLGAFAPLPHTRVDARLARAHGPERSFAIVRDGGRVTLLARLRRGGRLRIVRLFR